MAGQIKLCFVFLLMLHVSLVSCRHDYNQYLSENVKDESSTESSPPSSTGISTSKSESISLPDGLYSENVISPKANSYYSSNNDADEKPVQSGYTAYNEDDGRTILIIKLILIIGCIVAVGLIICCIAVCCPQRFKGRERLGYIISTNAPEQPAVNLMQPQIPQDVGLPYFAPQTLTAQQPPPYSTQPIQQQFQYPSSENLLNQNPVQPLGQQQNPIQPMGQQQPLNPYGYSNPETVSPPYPTKY